jgi:uncharacterized protein (DUF2141 family)
MGYTSVFGTGFVALISVLAISPMTSSATVNSSLDVSITGKRSAKGNMLVCLTANPKAFPDCSKDPNAQNAKVMASGSAIVHFDGIAPGAYAISMIHDENGNGKMDMRVFLPKEGFGFSRNPAITFGPPKFGAASFKVSAGANSQSVKIKYML